MVKEEEKEVELWWKGKRRRCNCNGEGGGGRDGKRGRESGDIVEREKGEKKVEAE